VVKYFFAFVGSEFFLNAKFASVFWNFCVAQNVLTEIHHLFKFVIFGAHAARL